MTTIAGRESLNRIKARLAELIGLPEGDLEIQWQQQVSDQIAVHVVIVAGNLRFVVEWQASGNTAAVTKAIHSLRHAVIALGTLAPTNLAGSRCNNMQSTLFASA